MARGGQNAKCSEADFIRMFEEMGAAGVARALEIGQRAVHERRQVIEGRIGRQLVSPTHRPHGRAMLVTEAPEIPGRLHFQVPNGIVLACSDAHFWPGVRSTAFRGFIEFCKQMKPAAVVVNGDMLDGASISRHPPLGWQKLPSLIEEIDAVKDRLGEITVAAGKARRFWPCGNHDARFSMRLATTAPEYARIHGVSLHDHFPDYEPCWSVFINDALVIKHRYKGGIHATHNNAVMSGMSMATGHLHSAKVTPFTDYTGTRWGVDLGCIADPYGMPFEYQEDSPRNHRSAFGVFTFVEGRLLQPELAMVIEEGKLDFRGQILNV